MTRYLYGEDVTDLESAMSDLVAATQRIRGLEADREAAMRDRDAALRAARAAGATYAVIEKATGMSTPTITKALRRE